MDYKNYFAYNKCNAYKSVFTGETGTRHKRMTDIVITDLSRFCGGMSSNFSTDELTMARAEGRREVLLYILRHINADLEELLKYNANPETDILE